MVLVIGMVLVVGVVLVVGLVLLLVVVGGISVELVKSILQTLPSFPLHSVYKLLFSFVCVWLCQAGSLKQINSVLAKQATVYTVGELVVVGFVAVAVGFGDRCHMNHDIYSIFLKSLLLFALIERPSVSRMHIFEIIILNFWTNTSLIDFCFCMRRGKKQTIPSTLWIR